MSNSSTRLTDLPNVGATVAKRLASIGVKTPEDLARVGPVRAWQRMQAREPGATLPVCYYLYSLQGALLGCHWNELPPGEKERLAREAKG